MSRLPALRACGLALLTLAALVPAAVVSAQRHSVHAVAHLGSSRGAENAPGSSAHDCGPHRSPLQHSIDRIYATQRRRLDHAIASLRESEIAGWGTLNGWRLYELYPPIYNCPDMQKVGNQPQDGGKIVCGLDTFMQHSECKVLSFGSNGEPSFERDLLARTPCDVHVFDPTLTNASKAALAAVPELAFYDYGLGAQDGVGDVNSMGAPGSGLQLKMLPTIMAELGVKWIDLLKIDIEGGEWAVLESLLDHYQGQDLPFTQLQIEFHYEPPATARQVLDILRRLEAAGLRVFSSEFNFWAGANVPGFIEMSLVNTRDCRVLV